MTDIVNGTVIGSISRLFRITGQYFLVRKSDDEIIHTDTDTIHEWFTCEEISEHGIGKLARKALYRLEHDRELSYSYHKLVSVEENISV